MQIDNTYLDRGRYWKHLQEATTTTAKFLIHGGLTERNKAPRFFLEWTVIEAFDIFF